jgi:hypothetical protein
VDKVIELSLKKGKELRKLIEKWLNLLSTKKQE